MFVQGLPEPAVSGLLAGATCLTGGRGGASCTLWVWQLLSGPTLSKEQPFPKLNPQIFTAWGQHWGFIINGCNDNMCWWMNVNWDTEVDYDSTKNIISIFVTTLSIRFSEWNCFCRRKRIPHNRNLQFSSFTTLYVCIWKSLGITVSLDWFSQVDTA